MMGVVADLPTMNGDGTTGWQNIFADCFCVCLWMSFVTVAGAYHGILGNSSKPISGT